MNRRSAAGPTTSGALASWRTYPGVSSPSAASRSCSFQAATQRRTTSLGSTAAIASLPARGLPPCQRVAVAYGRDFARQATDHFSDHAALVPVDQERLRVGDELGRIPFRLQLLARLSAAGPELGVVDVQHHHDVGEAQPLPDDLAGFVRVILVVEVAQGGAGDSATIWLHGCRATGLSCPRWIACRSRNA